ncbi:uncharacterized protein F4812DRAFT_457045 [Daldinia caldariorum]|uniref:uncharacterized protein n=1 Tax=Daldinia caldariorum TaxID=326644 RepID=UPI0020083F2B|nr:uncharacterized protein F4812DRAFT_457045 [Daldinia caldariorum]KAI1469645.1 hypothetical protein F4812DRAFT_457045 [Daldinia caldariorum]
MPPNPSPDRGVNNNSLIKQHVAARAEWNTLPCELQALIIDSLAPQDFRKAWFTWRLVSRQFRDVTEQVFKTRIAMNLGFQVYVGGLNMIRSTCRSFYDAVHMHRLEVVRLAEFSLEDAQAAFENKMTDSSLIHGTPERDMEQLFGSEYLPFALFGKYLWQQKGDSRPAWKGFYHPALLHNDVLFGLPFIYQGRTRGPRQTVTMPWKPMMSALMMQELELGEELSRLGRRDIEATRWRAEPSMEQGMRIAMSSEVVRFMRYETCLRAAIMSLSIRWERQSQDNRYFCRYEPIPNDARDKSWTDNWFDEWLYAVLGKRV